MFYLYEMFRSLESEQLWKHSRQPALLEGNSSSVRASTGTDRVSH